MRTRWIPVLLSILTLALVLECAKKQVRVIEPPKEDFDTEGWLDPNTFQVKVVGQPNQSAEGWGRRRRQAEKSAVILSVKRTVTLMAEKLGSAKFEGPIRDRYLDVIENGAIVRKIFDEEDNCAVTYRVRQKDLQRGVNALGR